MIKPFVTEIIELLRSEFREGEEAFRPPATEQQLQEAEAELGFALPADLRELYQVWNGEREGGFGLFFGLPFLPLADMMAEWRIWAGLEEEYALEGGHYSVPAGWIKERYINRYWLPISKDWGGNHLGLDLDPDEQGRMGQVINFGRDEEVKYVVALSLRHMLQFIRDVAKEKNYSIHEEEDYRFFSYGPGSVHFLDAIRKLELPVLHPIRMDHGLQDTSAWLNSLEESWQERILSASGSPDVFLREKQLRFIGEGITDITPLAHCREVRELILSANELESIEALRDCRQLKQLYLTKNPLSDLRPLQELPYLEELNLSKTLVTDIFPLAFVPKLRSLDLSETAIHDFTPLKQVKSLKELEVSGLDREQLCSLAELASLEKLTLVGLASGAEEAVEVLGQLVKLRTLELEEVSLSNLEFLRNCPNLQRVKLKDSSIQDASALAMLESLHSLELSGCPNLGKLEDLGKSASLRKITASFAQFALLKDRFDRKIDFSTITGSMTDEEDEIWYAYLKS